MPSRVLSDAEIAALNERFESAQPQAIVEWAVDTFGDGLSVGASFGGASGMAILHMVSRLKPDVHVFVLDTDYLFEETYETMRRAVPALGLTNVQVYKSKLTHEEQARQYGAALWMRDPDLCCELRKVEPNRRALEGRTAWVSGLRRDQSEGRAAIPIISWAEKFGVVKINPLANWSEKQTWAYILEHKVPYNPLLDRGYASIGCYNCTVPGVQGRAGRWQGFEKDECGLHT
ncbi:phosphoadenylyl-sulfate reductase [Tepidiforma bonchosmolovskayae]|jgi:phosphoadenosine phosphosulfate reductase|uniref:Adenosine 5'-phosphosulfate reductase n=1 Tax=Tepidiforma bonchosmolovskayae TaxID=2601677 RepID=A0ABX6C4Q9_9CHLR|nr:phosphoadenylyl-sulfate reductase [Tepidiforma bonchosmolovskayae]QFG04242.1 phosphoadenylyl-sulfate reductase [Tepidiforma bonchosmolovskayae]